MTAARDASQAALQVAAPPSPTAVGLSPQELARAYDALLAALTDRRNMGLGVAMGGRPTSGPVVGGLRNDINAIEAVAVQAGEETYRGWYLDALTRVGLPGDSAAVQRYTAAVADRISALTAQRQGVTARIAALKVGVQGLTPGTAPAIPGNPVTALSFDQPAYTERVNADGATERVMTSGPRFDLDANAAQAARAALDQVRADADNADRQVRERIAAFDGAVAALRAATSSSDSSLLSYARAWADVGASAQRQYAAQADLLLQRQDWMRARLADLAARDSTARRWIAAKTAALRAAGSRAALQGLASKRVALLAGYSGAPSWQTRFAQDSDYVIHRPVAEQDSTFGSWADTSGTQLWLTLLRTGLTATEARADTEWTRLQQAAGPRLANVQSLHAGLSSGLDSLYAAQADAVGALYDLYDRYLFWRAGSDSAAATNVAAVAPTRAPPTADELRDVALLRQRRAQLAADLTVPRVNTVQVTSLVTGPYTAELQFSWSGWHPSGTTEFRFRDTTGAGQALGGTFLSNGASGSLVQAYVTPDRSRAATLTRTFQVGVRGGAGFTGYGRSNYTLTFQAGRALPVVSGGGLLPDVTPPSRPVVTFPGRTEHPGANLAPEVWTGDPSQITVSWDADDPESGVAGYEVALWSTPAGPSGGGAALRPFWSVGGRTSVTIDRLSLAAGGPPVYVAVRARNPEGLVSAIGVSAAIRYDPSPPAFAAGAALQLAPSLLGGRVGVAAAAAVAPAGTSVPTTAACPVPAPSDKPTRPALTAAVPAIQLSHPSAVDGESGVEAYWWKLGTQPETAYAPTGWSRVTTSPTLAVSGAPLDFSGQFYLSVVATNYADLATPPLVYGPFQASDPTRPSDPSFCLALAGTGDRFIAQFAAWSDDPETGLVGYQYQVRTAGGAVVHPWPARGTDWKGRDDPSASRTTDQLKLAGGQSYVLEVRALNGRGATSGVTASGPLLYDVTPPATPSFTPVYRRVSTTSATVSLTVNTPNDVESGIASVQVAVGSSAGATDVVPWSTLAGAAAGKWTGTLSLRALPPGSTFWVQVRSRNGVGILSAVAQTAVTVP
jgi:hypothetical protein